MTPAHRRSQSCVREQEERTPMDGTKQTKSWVIGGVRTGGLPAMTDGF
jgi:hypothetical protein